MSTSKITRANGGEILQFGLTTIQIVEDGSGTDNRISAISSILPPHVHGPTPHIHLMHDESFYITNGVLRFTVGNDQWNAEAGDYVVIPPGASHEFENVSDQPVLFMTTFTPAFYINSFRELAKANAEGHWNKETEANVLMRYATVLCN